VGQFPPQLDLLLQVNTKAMAAGKLGDLVLVCACCEFQKVTHYIDVVDA
jgi:hypothetical protein